MKPAHEVFMDYLRDNGLSMTPQRALIVDAFLGEEGHFTSEDLFNKVRRRDSAIGLATVYRTLKLLTDSGLADAFDPGGGVAIYEHSYGHRHHDHLICTECNRKVEIMDSDIEKRQEELARENGFELESHRMLLFGVCPECMRKGRQ
ncbi:Fur family transcriptional regulator [Salidesulfovibrio onnuriiensis]|uniref:Fur family transcriptional regulator n=1 Tax=Salidesulfovibrio onnuriiensis TaxID=2583823 RepID=UPI0011C85048|nr:Fur family transcriptional regulator [Salidesulfovibrio onnuriiensis]